MPAYMPVGSNAVVLAAHISIGARPVACRRLVRRTQGKQMRNRAWESSNCNLKCD